MHCLVSGWTVLLADGRTWASIDDVASGRYQEWAGCFVQAQRALAWFFRRSDIDIVPRSWILDALHPSDIVRDIDPDELPLFAEVVE